MWIVTALGLGIGLAMDACAVSMANGLQEPKMKSKKAMLIAFFFGFFQMGMPILGYLAVTALSSALGEKFTTIFGYFVPWIALGLLLFLGIKMIVESIKESKKENKEENAKSLTLKTLFIQAIATSIDALSVGIIFAEQEPYISYISFGIIGILTFIISLVAVYVGKKFGTIFSNKAALAGGIILIGIGFEIFFSNWNDVVAGIQAIFSLIAIK